MRLHRGAVALALCAALGCGPGRRPARPEPVGRTVHYQPMEMQRDARQPGQAVILGTDDADGSTVLAIPVAARTVVVDATVMSHTDAGPATGAMVAIAITAAPSAPAATSVPAAPGPPATARTPGAASAPGARSGTAAVTAAGAGGGVQIGGAEGAGARWRAGVWSAALVAMAALGKELADVALSAVPSGPVEGTPSALLAAGFLAAMAGDAIDPAATLTGAILPDGAIGPVAGLPEQVAAAIARGKARIGYPSGMRVARSAATGEDVDLVQLARGRGAEAVELADVHDAYRLLTGHRLPATVPVAAAAMAFEPALRDRLEARYGAWQERLAEEWAPLLLLDQAGRLPAAVAAMVQSAHDRSERAQALHRAGKLAAAQGEMRAAWLHAAAANQTSAVIAKIRAGDVEEAVAAVAALDPGDASVRAIFTRIGEPGETGDPPPATLAGHLASLEALGAALRGGAFHERAADSLRAAAQRLGELRGKPAAELSSPATAEAASGVVAPAVLWRLRAAAQVAVAEQVLELVPDGGVACTCPPANLARVAAGFQAAAAAAAEHLDAVLVEPLARKLGIPADEARRRAGELEPDYAIAARLGRPAADDPAHEPAAAWGEGSPAAGLLVLAGAEAAYASAARVLARYDALGGRRDEAGQRDEATGAGAGAVDHPQALRRLLTGAERAARAAAHAAQIATGAIPPAARLAYQVAVARAAGGVGDQLDALAELWAATALSEAAVALARSCERASPAGGAQPGAHSSASRSSASPRSDPSPVSEKSASITVQPPVAAGRSGRAEATRRDRAARAPSACALVRDPSRKIPGLNTCPYMHVIESTVSGTGDPRPSHRKVVQAGSL